jgi:predicted transcriptional regulator
MGQHQKSRVPRILALKKMGVQNSQIAELLAISPSAVSLALRRKNPVLKFTEINIAQECVSFLETEAMKNNVSSDQMAHAIFVDAIIELVDKQKDNKT